jgi:diguanylate cyclase (GGDEF)-like protein/PAS domain S-box-containing protein
VFGVKSGTLTHVSPGFRRSELARPLAVLGAVAFVVAPTSAALVGGPLELVTIVAVVASSLALCVLAARNWIRTRQLGWLLVTVWALGRPAANAVAATFVDSSAALVLTRSSALFAVVGAAGGVLLCLEGRPAWRPSTVVSESLVVATSAMLALWVVIEPNVDRIGDGHVDQLTVTLVVFVMQMTMLGIVVISAAHQPWRPRLRWLAVALALGSFGSAVAAYRSSLAEPVGQAGLVLICMVTTLPFLGFVVSPDRTPVPARGRSAGRAPVHVALALSIVAIAVELALTGDIDGTFGWLVVLSGAAVVVNQVCSYRDARELNEQLEANDERLRAAFDSAPMGIAMADAHGTVTEANPALCEMLGWPLEAIVGSSASDFMSDVERATHAELQRQLASHRIDRFTQELYVPHADGRLVRVSITVSRLDFTRDGAHTIAILQDVTEHHAAQERLQHLATHDALTGLGNRDLLVEHLEAARLSARLDAPVAAMFIDLDQFKVVNDSLGHAAGDRLLLESAARIEGVVAAAGLVTRFGGDEFCVGLDPAAPSEHAALAERVAVALRGAVDLGAPELTYPSASIGLAYGRLDCGVDELLSEADAAMYLAKERGRDRVESFTPADRRASRDAHRRVGELHRALAEDELVVHHQPVVDTQSELIVGTEALVRWQHPELGLLPPGAFLPVAQATGLIVDLGALVLRGACEHAAGWNAAAAATTSWNGCESGTTVAVNVDVHQLSRPGFPETVAEVLSSTGLAPDLLWLELTETALMTETRVVERTLGRLREMGVHLSVDDFGTGYSSLTYLKRFPVEALKIDRSFIAGLGVHSDDTEIVSALVSLGQRLDLKVIAEGVEEAPQLEMLRVLGCPLVQGFLFGTAVPATELGHRLAAQAQDLRATGRAPRVAHPQDALDALGLPGPTPSPG